MSPRRRESVAGALALALAIAAPAIARPVEGGPAGGGGDGNGNATPGVCCWENGAPAADGMLSHLGGGVPSGTKAADDFTLAPGAVHELLSVTGILHTDSYPAFTTATLEIYEDCNGGPGRLIHIFPAQSITELGNVGDDLRRVEVAFNVGGVAGPVVLRPGTYWVSIAGITDGQGTDISYFALADGPVKGSLPRRIEGSPPSHPGVYTFGDDWVSAGECCGLCADLSFSVCTRALPILIDQTPIAYGPTVTPFASTSENRAANRRVLTADDFLTGPCDDERIAYIESFIYTDCVGFAVDAIILPDECADPHHTFTMEPIATLTASRATPVGAPVMIDGRARQGYRVEFTGVDLPLQHGHNYWISIAVRATFTFTSRAYVAFWDRCGSNCDRNFNPAQILGPSRGYNAWTPLDRDVAFLIAVHPHPVEQPTTAEPTCPADFNGDGEVNSADIYAYLTVFFNGCP